MVIGFFATLRPIVGGKTIEVALPAGTTVAALVDHLVGSIPGLGDAILDEAGGLSRKVHVFIEGRSAIYLEHGLATELSASQRVDIFPAVAGG
jgi:molybdopterin synthase sulfur carrier subunit